jgi:hypothetical protein
MAYLLVFQVVFEIIFLRTTRVLRTMVRTTIRYSCDTIIDTGNILPYHGTRVRTRVPAVPWYVYFYLVHVDVRTYHGTRVLVLVPCGTMVPWYSSTIMVPWYVHVYVLYHGTHSTIW